MDIKQINKRSESVFFGRKGSNHQEPYNIHKQRK